MTVTLGNININVKLKLVALDSLRYTAKLFRPRHSLEDCVNSASAVAFVVLNSEETSNAERASEPAVYKYVFHINCSHVSVHKSYITHQQVLWMFPYAHPEWVPKYQERTCHGNDVIFVFRFQSCHALCAV